MSAERALHFTLNGAPVETATPPHWTLLRLLRERLLAYEVKYGCGEGECGACAVLLDDEPINACLVLALHVDGRRISTARGLGLASALGLGVPVGAQGFAPDHGLAQGHGPDHGWAQGLAPLQEAFVAHGAVQCGFCIPGMLVTATHLLRTNPTPSREHIRAALSANLCRCTGYQKIVDAVAAAAERQGSGVGSRESGY